MQNIPPLEGPWSPSVQEPFWRVLGQGKGNSQALARSPAVQERGRTSRPLGGGAGGRSGRRGGYRRRNGRNERFNPSSGVVVLDSRMQAFGTVVFVPVHDCESAALRG